MRKFLDKFNQSRKNGEVTESLGSVTSSDPREGLKEVREKYTKLLGRKALLTNRGVKDSRIVRIDQVHQSFLVASYPHHSPERMGRVTTTVSFASLLCEDSKLVLEE